MRYTARKILTLLVTMLVVSLLTFAAFDLISGDPAATLDTINRRFLAVPYRGTFWVDLTASPEE